MKKTATHSVIKLLLKKGLRGALWFELNPALKDSAQEL